MSIPPPVGFIFAVLLWLIKETATKDVTDIRIQAATLEFANPDYLLPGSYVRVSRKSRSKTPGFNAFFPFHKDLPVETLISYHTFQKAGNAWRSTLIKGNAPFCTFLESKNKMIRSYFAASDFPHKCPVKKGNYSFKDLSYNGEEMPPVLPASAEFRTRISWGLPQPIILTYAMEVKIDKRGKGAHDNLDVASILSVNKSLGMD